MKSTSDNRKLLNESLQGVADDAYGPSYRDHTLEIYKTYLAMADKISERREKANSYFLAVNTMIIALLAKDIFDDTAQVQQLTVLIPIAGIVLCYLWHRILRSYRDLNSAKFKVVHEIERQLPLRPFDAEWEAVGRGKNAQFYLPFTHVEIIVPWVFMAFQAVLLLFSIPWKMLAGRIAG